jgi:hypothetical protein
MKGLVDILEMLGMKDKNPNYPILKYNQVSSFRVCCILPKGRFLKN